MKRRESGQKESRPSDYRDIAPSDVERAQHAARKRIEDIQLERELARDTGY